MYKGAVPNARDGAILLGMSNTAAGRLMHWRDGSGVCHPAISYAGDEGGSPVTFDLIQIDSLNLGAVVPTVRNNIVWDSGAFSQNPTLTNLHCHDTGGCDGGP